MKTPLQELLNYTTDLLHTFDSEQRVAMAVLDYLKTNKKEMLEREKGVIETTYNNGQTSNWSKDMGLMGDWYYGVTFNTKEK